MIPQNQPSTRPTDADLWEQLVKAGAQPDSATSLVTRRKTWESLKPADAWERLVAAGIPEHNATAYLKQSAPRPIDRISSYTAGLNPAAAMFREDYDQARALTDHLGQGLTFGFGRNLLAAVQSMFGDRSYSDNLEKINSTLRDERAANPGASTAGEITGAVVSPINKILAALPFLGAAETPTLFSKVAQGARTGAAAGALSGAGNADGGATEKLKGALVGGTAGAVAGGTIAPVAAAVGAAARSVTGRANPIDVLIPAIAKSGSTPAAIAESQPSMLADALPDLTRTVRSMSPAARRVIDPALASRRAQQLPAITEALERGLGVRRGSVQRSVSDLVEQRAIDARPLYTRAYAAPAISDPEILETLRLPQFQSAYKVAQRIARTEGTPLPDLPSGEIPVPATIRDNADAVAAFTKAYRSQHPEPGIPVRALDLVKRGLNDVIDAGLRSGNMGRAEARALQSRLSGMLARVDVAAPEYALARANFAGHSALVDAAQAGLEFMSPKLAAADVSSHLASLTPSEAELYRRGAIEALSTRLEAARGSATGGADLVQKFYSSVGGRAKVQALFPDKKAFDAFDKAMARVATENSTAGFVTGGSQTADKLAQQDALGTSIDPQTVGSFIRHPLRATLAAAADATNRVTRVGTQRAAERVAPALVAGGPELEELLIAIQRAGRPAARDAVLSSVAGSRTGALASQLPGLLSRR